MGRGHPEIREVDAPLFPGRHKGGHTHGTRTEGTRATRTPNWAEPIEPNLFYRSLRCASADGTTPARPAEKSVLLHDLRHTFATMALDDGHDYREVSEWLGHADYATTLRVYAHWIPDTCENNMSAPPVPAGNVVPLRRSAG